MCFVPMKAPKIPPPPQAPQAAQFQSVKQPDNGSSSGQLDDEIRRRRAMAATAFTGALGLGAPKTTSTVLGG